MSERTLRLTDRLAQALLLLWAGAALGFGALAPLIFRMIPSRDLAGSLAGAMVGRLDTLAWGAFLLSALLVFGLRWLNQVDRSDLPLTPTRLWGMAALVALIFCLLSSGLIHPRLAELRAQMTAPLDTYAQTHPLRAAYDHNHRLSTLAYFLRIVLALLMAYGVEALPMRKEERE